MYKNDLTHNFVRKCNYILSHYTVRIYIKMCFPCHAYLVNFVQCAGLLRFPKIHMYSIDLCCAILVKV